MPNVSSVVVQETESSEQGRRPAANNVESTLLEPLDKHDPALSFSLPAVHASVSTHEKELSECVGRPAEKEE